MGIRSSRDIPLNLQGDWISISVVAVSAETKGSCLMYITRTPLGRDLFAEQPGRTEDCLNIRSSCYL